MKREVLQQLKRADLLERAKRAGIRGRSRMTKAALVDALLDAAEPAGPPTGRVPDAGPTPRADRVELAARAPVPSCRERPGAAGAAGNVAPAAAAPPLTLPTPAGQDADLRPLPALNRVWLTARDPDWLYAWWDYGPHQLDAVRAAAGAGRLQLRLHRFGDGDWHEVQRVRIPFDARNWYLRAGLPGAVFEAEIGLEDQAGSFHLLARSRRAEAPDSASRADVPVEVVTIPFDHLFGELLDFIRRYLPGRSDIAAALREILNRGIQTPFPVEAAPPWSPAQDESMRRTTPPEAAAPGSRRSWSGRPTSPRGPLSGRSSP